MVIGQVCLVFEVKTATFFGGRSSKDEPRAGRGRKASHPRAQGQVKSLPLETQVGGWPTTRILVDVCCCFFTHAC